MLTFSRKNHSSLLLAVIVVLMATSQAHAQPRIPDKKISIKADGISLHELLNLIQQKSGISFSYNPNKIPLKTNIAYTAQDKTLSSVLEDLRLLYDLKFMLVENQIILKTEKRAEKKTVAAASFTYSGTVKDKRTGEALIGASVVITDLNAGTITNGFGYYSLTVRPGHYVVTASFIGYKPYRDSIDLRYAIKDVIMLEEEPPMLQEVTVVSQLHDAVQDIAAGMTNIRPKIVEQRPALLGEMDVVKTLESVPGVKLHSDGSTFYSVRGGNRDQNLILLDDAPIYNPSHLLGVFSTIIPDAVNDITLHKGSMPASLGGRLSSVMEVRTKKGNDQHFECWGSTGFISTKAGIEGPIKKNASSFLVSARASNIGWLFKKADSDIKQFDFFDVTGKVNFKLNRSNQVFFSSYTGADNYTNTTNGIAWSNTAGTLRWNHLFNAKLFMNTTLAAGTYDYSLYTDVATKTRWTSHIGNLNLKSDFSYFVRPLNEIRFGWSVNGYNFNPGNLKSNVALPATPTLSTRNSVEYVLYADHEITFHEKLGIDYGLRLTSWKNTGEAFEYVFNENHQPIDTLYYTKGQGYSGFVKMEPRLTLNYMLTTSTSVKASYARNVQNVHLISNSLSPFNSLEVWLPSSVNIKPQVADQITVGYYHTATKRTTLSAEAYYKVLQNQIDYEAHAETLLNPLLESQLRFGKGSTYGLELMARRDEGRYHGWIGYTFARAFNKIDGINNNRAYRTFYDRPHQVNVMLTYDASKRWTLGMNWNYSTGAPYSAPISYYYYNGEEVPIYGDKNNSRLPDYHRLDLSATLRLNKDQTKRFNHNISFSIFNLYGHKNLLFINNNKVETSDGNYKVPSNVLNADRQMSEFYLFRFTPSFTYNFKFL